MLMDDRLLAQIIFVSGGYDNFANLCDEMQLLTPTPVCGDRALSRTKCSLFPGSKNHQDPNDKLFWKQKVEYKEDVSGFEAQQQYLDALPSQVSQDIVPQALINHFVSMTNPAQAQNTDNEIAHHCAFSLPAVALTLGRKNWILLKNAYDRLASDMQVIIYSLRWTSCRLPDVGRRGEWTHEFCGSWC